MAPILFAIGVFGVIGLLYWFPVRRWFLHWGATQSEVRQRMSGDVEVPNSTYETTLAVTINAPPAAVWPWLLQLGYRRGGLYSYDWLDRLFGFLDAPSANRILPEFQNLTPGDVIPIGRGGGFPVKAIDPLRSMVLAGSSSETSWMWQLALVPIGDISTRLISRNGGRLPRRLASGLFMAALEPAAFLMTRRMLIGIKKRVETSGIGASDDRSIGQSDDRILRTKGGPKGPIGPKGPSGPSGPTRS